MLILAEIAAWPTTQLTQLETLRLFPPVPIAKSTGKEPRTLRVGEKTIVIPANTLLIPNHVAIHTHPRYWGPDPLVWRPSRWIQSEASTRDDGPNNALDVDSITTPHKGSFIAWSEGIRNCPGKKFSQVVFVEAMAGLFRDWHVDPVPEGTENLDTARRRVMPMVEEDTGQVLLLQMLHPETAALVWKRR
jgi:cytochrome P450